MDKIEGVKKGFIVNDEFVENDNGNFYAFDDVESLKAFFETITKEND